MNRTAFAALAAASLLAAAPAFAAEVLDQQAAAPDVAGRAGATAVEDVVVTANRSAQPIERVGASVTVLTQAAIEARQLRSWSSFWPRRPASASLATAAPARRPPCASAARKAITPWS
ncbi:hypothetical protein [Brevundimonas diminuta]|uniref:hypothetical protein n=1 Tax=Brevundimonas diminuta TaxID=293 RepID=UPI003D9A1188